MHLLHHFAHILHAPGTTSCFGQQANKCTTFFFTLRRFLMRENSFHRIYQHFACIENPISYKNLVVVGGPSKMELFLSRANFITDNLIHLQEVEGEEESRKKSERRKMEEDFGSSKMGRIRKYLWDLTEYPETSKAAQVNLTRPLSCSDSCRVKCFRRSYYCRLND